MNHTEVQANFGTINWNFSVVLEVSDPFGISYYNAPVTEFKLGMFRFACYDITSEPRGHPNPNNY